MAIDQTRARDLPFYKQEGWDLAERTLPFVGQSEILFF